MIVPDSKVMSVEGFFVDTNDVGRNGVKYWNLDLGKMANKSHWNIQLCVLLMLLMAPYNKGTVFFYFF